MAAPRIFPVLPYLFSSRLSTRFFCSRGGVFPRSIYKRGKVCYHKTENREFFTDFPEEAASP